MPTSEYNIHMDMWVSSFFMYWHHHLQALVVSLSFEGHQMEAMLVECKSQRSTTWLLECLRSMAMLRRIRLIHFRCAFPQAYPYFRFLEARIRSDQAVLLRSLQESRDQTQAWLSINRRSPPRVTNMTDEGVKKSVHEMEATATVLYRKPGIPDAMTPQRNL